MTSAGGFHAADISGRMAIFGRLFGERVGAPETTLLRTPEDVVAMVRDRVPRSQGPAEDDAPVFEAAAYVGEWIRGHADRALWIAEGPFEPHLQMMDGSRAIVVVLPLISILRTATTAGYDGLGEALRGVLADVGRKAARAPIDRLRVEPEADRERVVRWVRRHRSAADAARASLWRRCQTCGTIREDDFVMSPAGMAWEAEAASAATVLSRRAFSCACGGLPGDTSRFLMLRRMDGETRLCDIHVSATRSRVATWALRGEDVVPFDATTLASLTSPH